ncbi:hypothetical protein D4Q76_02830 [archaeon]|nr:MAG: hypothetical protein D4Q76_02830 [archaeon]
MFPVLGNNLIKRENKRTNIYAYFSVLLFMRTEKGIIFLKEDELAKILSNLCRPNEYADRCRYNGNDKDFAKCGAYQILSAILPEYKERGDDDKRFFDSATEEDNKECPDAFTLCPVIKIGFREGKTDKEYSIRVEPVNSE